jgi:UDP-3-O-[3-hydroxymyristoyl] glucosamine N-acyltransferase
MNDNTSVSRSTGKNKIVRYTLDNILPLIVGKFEIEGDQEGKYFANVKPVTEADEESLVFVDHARKDKQQLADRTKARIMICDNSIERSPEALQSKCFILADNPKFVFARIVNRLFTTRMPYGIHPTAYIHPEAKVHPNTYIGPFAYIGKSIVGEDSVIYGQCFIYDGVTIGRNVTINAGCSIGADGYGYLRNENEEWENFPHIGGIIIEDSVDIGSNTCIDRGALGNTIIKEGAKVDNLVHVAHNVVIGRHAAVIANTMIGGSTKIGDYAWVAPSATLRDVIDIGRRSTVGLAAVVTKSIPDNEIWAGSPARPVEEFKALQQKLKNLK